VYVSILLNNLNSRFKDFAHRTVTTMKEVPDFEDVVKMLYKEERLNKRENTTQAMAAQFKRFQKD